MSFSNYKRAPERVYRNYWFRLLYIIKLSRILFYCLKRIKIASQKAIFLFLGTVKSVLGSSINNYFYVQGMFNLFLLMKILFLEWFHGRKKWTIYCGEGNSAKIGMFNSKQVKLEIDVNKVRYKVFTKKRKAPQPQSFHLKKVSPICILNVPALRKKH